MNPQQYPFQEFRQMPDEDRVTYFALTDSRNKKTPFGIKKEDRSRHTYVIGKTGMGKSTLLENMAAQDILNGEGLCFLDPHGGSAEKLLEYVPEDRIKDVLYFAPFDLEYPISFNVLENVDADKRHLVVAGLMSTFEKIWVDAWSARMAYILQNTIGALLEFPGATLLGVNRMYIDKEYRKNVIAKITDPSIRSFWVDEYSKYTDRYAQEATPAIQNKIGQFSSNALVRNVIGQSESSFNIRDLMDQRKIFIVNLSKGRVGENNANLLGSMLITKIYLAAMSRADVTKTDMRQLPPFYLYVDEFQNFANKSFADILSEARKYKLALTIAHQYIEQMEDEVRAAVFGNVGTMIAFRVGAYDAEVLEKEFAPVFTVDDIVNLGARQIYLKLMIDGVSSHPFSAVTMPPVQEPEKDSSGRAVAFSRSQYSRPRQEVEKNISDWVTTVYEDPDKDAKEEARMMRREAREKEARVQTGSQSRNDFEPRKTRQTGSAQASFPRKVFPKKSNDTAKKDLRDILTRVTNSNDTNGAEERGNSVVRKAKKEQPKDTVPQAQEEGRSENAVAPQQTFTPKPKKDDDGKGITEEGRGELRALLSSLTGAQKKEETKKEEVQKPEQKKEVSKQQAAQGEEVGQKKEAPMPEQKKKMTPEIPREKMEEMLRVEKPNL